MDVDGPDAAAAAAAGAAEEGDARGVEGVSVGVMGDMGGRSGDAEREREGTSVEIVRAGMVVVSDSGEARNITGEDQVDDLR